MNEPSKTKTFAKRKRTYMRMLKSTLCTILAIILVLVILQLLGINVSSMLAGVGIASIVIGFALQDILKDIIRGLEIISSNYYDIGDVIRFDKYLGQVQSITLRTTKIRDITTANLVSIANRNIDKVEVDTGHIYIKVPLPYELKIAKADAVMTEIAGKLASLASVTSATYQGLAVLDESSLNYQLDVTCEPVERIIVQRQCLHQIIETLELHKISVPYPQLDLHNK